MAEPLRCPACGAPDHSVAGPDGVHACEHCGVRYRLRPGGQPAVEPLAGQPRTSRALVLLSAGIAVLGVVVAAVVGLSQAPSPPPPTTAAPVAPAAPVSPTTSSLAVPEDPGPPTADLVVHGTRPASGASFYVLADVTNTSPYTIDKPELVVVLSDADGRELFQDNGFAALDVLAPGQGSPAEVLVKDPPPHAAYTVELRLRRSTFVPALAEGLRLETLPPSEDGSGVFRIGGKVFNEGSTPAHFVEVIAVGRDEAGAVLGIDHTYAAGQEVLPPGESARFQLGYLRYEQRPARWDFLVVGRVAD